ncbi:MAG: hypothetical protein KF901_03080 [Myxococcales bacterium]|nr:hypothetical protein [Myxococcales bacterium]
MAIPLLGLVLVIRHGSGLEAPPSLGGAWITELRHEDLRVEVTQSGRYLSVRMEGVVQSLELVHGDQRTKILVGSGDCAGSLAELRRTDGELALLALERTCDLPERLVLRRDAR